MYEGIRFNKVDQTSVFVEVVAPFARRLSCATTCIHYLASDTVSKVDNATVDVPSWAWLTNSLIYSSRARQSIHEAWQVLGSKRKRHSTEA